MDDQLPQTLFDVFSVYNQLVHRKLAIISRFFYVLQIGLNCLGVIVVVGVVNLWLVLPVLILAVAFYKVRQWYLETARAIKRLEATSNYTILSLI